MPKLTCPCGHAINLSPLPNPNGLVFFAEARLERLTNTLVSSLAKEGADAETTLFEHLPGRDSPQAYECEQCGRIAVFRRGGDVAPATWLRPDSADAPRLTVLAG